MVMTTTLSLPQKRKEYIASKKRRVVVMVMTTTLSRPQKMKEGIASKKRRVVVMLMTTTLFLTEEEGGDSFYEEEGGLVMTLT